MFCAASFCTEHRGLFFLSKTTLLSKLLAYHFLYYD